MSSRRTIFRRSASSTARSTIHGRLATAVRSQSVRAADVTGTPATRATCPMSNTFVSWIDDSVHRRRSRAEVRDLQALARESLELVQRRCRAERRTSFRPGCQAGRRAAAAPSSRARQPSGRRPSASARAGECGASGRAWTARCTASAWARVTSPCCSRPMRGKGIVHLRNDDRHRPWSRLIEHLEVRRRMRTRTLRCSAGTWVWGIGVGLCEALGHAHRGVGGDRTGGSGDRDPAGGDGSPGDAGVTGPGTGGRRSSTSSGSAGATGSPASSRAPTRTPPTPTSSSWPRSGTPRCRPPGPTPTSSRARS